MSNPVRSTPAIQEETHSPSEPAGQEPPCDEETFALILDVVVADCAPRVFAIVAECDVRAEAVIAAWGMAFDDHAELVTVEGGARMSLSSPEGALRAFRRGRLSPRVVWANPHATTSGGALA
jgi:hypothetical protein